MDTLNRTAPLARRERLMVQELSDEVLVYDLDRHRAHSLNPTAAWLWRHSDGTMSVTEMAARWHEELDLPQDEELVWLALDRLARAHLLEGGFARPATVPNPSRRALMRSLAAAGGLALVTSIIAPNAYALAVSFPPCQAGLVCTNGHCCVCNSTGLPGNCVQDCGQGSNAGSCASFCSNQGGVKCCNAGNPGMTGTCSA